MNSRHPRWLYSVFQQTIGFQVVPTDLSLADQDAVPVQQKRVSLPKPLTLEGSARTWSSRRPAAT